MTLIVQLKNFGGFVGCKVGVFLRDSGGIGVCKDRKAIVRKAGFKVGSKEDIRGLEIAVDEPPSLVDIGEALSYILCYFKA